MEDKKQIRQFIRNEKKLRSADQMCEQSEKIMSLLEMHERFQKARVVLMYYALPDEPQTQLCLDRWAKEKEILLPVVVGDDLILRRYTGRDSLVEGEFHIMEPQGEVFTNYEAIELIVVPGMAFDEAGNRLGRGKGYYDKLLCKSSLQHAFKLGVCFDFQKIDYVPVAEFDIPMDGIL